MQSETPFSLYGHECINPCVALLNRRSSDGIILKATYLDLDVNRDAVLLLRQLLYENGKYMTDKNIRNYFSINFSKVSLSSVKQQINHVCTYLPGKLNLGLGLHEYSHWKSTIECMNTSLKDIDSHELQYNYDKVHMKESIEKCLELSKNAISFNNWFVIRNGITLEFDIEKFFTKT